jgi:C-terminal processing protease CtpA/Prc
VLVDRHTASASEYFAAVLRDNGAATIVGERTMGAGCGYTNGGIPVVLPHSGVRIRMPDCVRYRADGRSELEGVAPDVAVNWSEGDRGELAVEGVKQALRGYRSSTAKAPATVPE